MSNKVTPYELEELIKSCIVDGDPLLISGSPGIGKTDIVKRAAKLATADLFIFHPVVDDPVDYKGLPGNDPNNAAQAIFRIFGNLAKLVNATRRTVAFFDDLGQAPGSIQAAIMQLILGREINGVRISDNVVFIAATNRASDMAGVTALIEPLKSRFITIVELIPDVLAWCDWAAENDGEPVLIAYMRYRGHEVLSKFVPTRLLTNSSSPRTWWHINRIQRKKLSAPVERAAMMGAGDPAHVTEYLVFRTMYANIVKVDDILNDPKNAALPPRTKADQLYAVSSALAHRATTQTLRAIAVYAQRLVDAKLGEYAVLILREATRRDPQLAYTDVFVKLQSSELGQLYSGTVQN